VNIAYVPALEPEGPHTGPRYRRMCDCTAPGASHPYFLRYAFDIAESERHRDSNHPDTAWTLTARFDDTHTLICALCGTPWQKEPK
jgi:hypothetical protein